MVHAGLYGFTEENCTKFYKLLKSETFSYLWLYFTVAQSGVASLIPKLLELYLEVLKEDDAVLRNLSLQGLSHLIGTCLNHQDLEKVNGTLLDLLQKSTATDSVIAEIGHFFCKSAEKNENLFHEQVLVKLLDIAVSGNSNFTN
jgi:hypothetical protein